MSGRALLVGSGSPSDSLLLQSGCHPHLPYPGPGIHELSSGASRAGGALRRVPCLVGTRAATVAACSCCGSPHCSAGIAVEPGGPRSGAAVAAAAAAAAAVVAAGARRRAGPDIHPRRPSACCLAAPASWSSLSLRVAAVRSWRPAADSVCCGDRAGVLRLPPPAQPQLQLQPARADRGCRPNSLELPRSWTMMFKCICCGGTSLLPRQPMLHRPSVVTDAIRAVTAQLQTRLR
jgi:hypothetical protein